MSGKRNTSSNSLSDFEFPEIENEFEFGDNEGMSPEPSPTHGRSAKSQHQNWTDEDHGEEFSDIEPGHEEEEEYHAEEEVAEPPAPQGKSLFSKLILPVGGATMVAIGGLGAYSMGLFDWGSSSEQRHLNLQPQAVQTAPRVNPMPALPNLPQDQQAAQRMPQGALRQTPQQVVQNPATFAAPALPPPTMMQPAPAPAPAPAVSPAIESVIRDLVASTDSLNRTVSTQMNDINSRINGLASSITARFDETDKKIASAGEKLAVLDGKIDAVSGKVDGMKSEFDNIEHRLSALEDSTLEAQRRAALPAQKTTAHGKTVSAPPVGGINHHVAGAPSAEPAQAQTAQAQAVQAESIKGFSLRGVARGTAPTSAWIKTPSGSFVVNIGQSVAGAGTIKEIRRAGDSWEVVTSDGVILP